VFHILVVDRLTEYVSDLDNWHAAYSQNTNGFSLAQSGSGPRPEAAGRADAGVQRTPQHTAAATGGGAPPPADGRRPADNAADDRALVPYQAETGNAR
jgi:hypothetical protein